MQGNQALSSVENRALNCARAISLIYLGGSLISLVAWSWIGHVSLWQWYVSLGAMIGYVLAAFALPRAFVSVGWFTAIFLGASGIILAAGSVDTQQMAESGLSAISAPFVAPKLVALVVGMVAPQPVWAGYLVIGVSTIVPVLQTQISSEVIRGGFTDVEPWLTLIYTMCGFFIFRYRMKSIERKAELIRLESERKALNELNHIFLALRDFTNSPLQSVEFVASLLELNEINREDAAKHLRIFLAELDKLNHVLNTYGANRVWSTSDVSFDPLRVINQRLSGFTGE